VAVQSFALDSSSKFCFDRVETIASVAAIHSSVDHGLSETRHGGAGPDACAGHTRGPVGHRVLARLRPGKQIAETSPTIARSTATSRRSPRSQSWSPSASRLHRPVSLDQRTLLSSIGAVRPRRSPCSVTLASGLVHASTLVDVVTVLACCSRIGRSLEDRFEHGLWYTFRPRVRGAFFPSTEACRLRTPGRTRSRDHGQPGVRPNVALGSETCGVAMMAMSCATRTSTEERDERRLFPSGVFFRSATIAAWPSVAALAVGQLCEQRLSPESRSGVLISSTRFTRCRS